VGHGKADYQRARSLLQTWQHFDLGWAFVNAPRVCEGAAVIVTAFTLFCWSMNPLRIISVEEGPRHLQLAAGTMAKGEWGQGNKGLSSVV
jgi:hypothetical protein